MTKVYRSIKSCSGNGDHASGGWTLCLLLLSAALSGVVLAASPGDAAPSPGGDPLDEFVRQLGEEQRARIAPIVRAASTNTEARKSSVLEALLALNPDLMRALGSLNADHPADALVLLDKLAGSPDPFLAKHAAWFRIQGLIGLERYEDALAAMPAVQTNAARYTQLTGEMLYTEGLLQSYLLDRQAAAATLQRYLDLFPEALAEQRGAALAILDEIQHTRTESLPEVATLMNESRRRLGLNDSGDLTQTRQAQIVKVLDVLIEKLEKQGGGGGGGGAPSPGGQGGASGGRGSGAQSSSLAGGASGTSVDKPSERGNPDAWAKAYARDREAVKKELQTRLPERYRELIEQYYRSLSSEGKTGGEGQK